MNRPHVVVVGGGLAGLQAAVACTDSGARVTLLEARPRLGGATWSTRKNGLDVDNGQHVFLRCCKAYRAFLARLGVEERVFLQPRLSVPVLAPGHPTQWIRRSRLPAPLHLAASLARFAHLAPRERWRAAGAAAALGRVPLDDPATDEARFGDWLRGHGQGERATSVFWDLLLRPTLNLPAEDASLGLAAKVFQTGLLERSDAGDIGWSRVPLGSLHAEPAADLLARAGADVRLRARVDAIEVEEGRPCVWSDGERIRPDALVLATDHEAAARLLPPAAGCDLAGIASLGRSPILNLHVHLDRRVMSHEFAVATLDSPLEWIFDRTRSSGADRGQVLAISLSAADPWLGMPVARLREIFVPALAALFPQARDARVLQFFATCERAATFRQEPGTRRRRPRPATSVAGLVLAGAWTDTGWPATMEGAVRSGVEAARVALEAAGHRRRSGPGASSGSAPDETGSNPSHPGVAAA